MKCLVWMDWPSTWCLLKTLEKESWEVMACCMWCVCWTNLSQRTNLVSILKCVKWVLDEFPNVTLNELFDELPPRRWVNHAIKVISKVAFFAKAQYWMKNWRKSRFNLRNSLRRDTLNLTSHHMGHLSSLFTRRTRHWRCVWIIEPQQGNNEYLIPITSN